MKDIITKIIGAIAAVGIVVAFAAVLMLYKHECKQRERLEKSIEIYNLKQDKR